ncbi:unnamed protein product [Rotaria sp. Silwood1]|nr:unnamed protein product [Rotaria sp. Silwood1]CAF4996253.1 unnamed protein product [Rotaria sp. Silwood1]
MRSWLIYPSSQTENSRRIELAGIDLRIAPCINNIFVYPSDLNINQLNDALSRTLSLWPLVAGRCVSVDNEHYFIEMSNSTIPVTLINNIELNKWPLDSKVVRDSGESQLVTYLDEVPSVKMIFNYPNEPLFRLKVTHIVQSGEWVMGTSWSHVLGDAYTCANFLHTLSRFYQHLEPLKPLPIFERRLWCKDEVDQSLLPAMKHLTDSIPTEKWLKANSTEEVTHDQLNLHFSGEQLTSLRRLVPDSTLTTHDVMIAYIIMTLNTHCFSNDKQIILNISIVVNYHGVSDSIAPSNLFANCHLRTWSGTFEDPYSLSNIAKSIRRLIIHSRSPEFLERWLPTEDKFLRDMVRDDLRMNADNFTNGIVVNSNFRYDWASLVDLGHTDKCRFYTEWTKNLFLRIFRLNPTYDGTQWVGRDREGAEVAFRIEKIIKQKFLAALQQDIKENFVNVKK